MEVRTMGTPKNLILVRHAESQGNEAYRNHENGDKDAFTEEFLRIHSSKWQLTEDGRKQAKQAGEWIRENTGLKFNYFYSSDYIRALETALLLNLSKAQWIPNNYLEERSWGTMDMIPPEKRKIKFREELKVKDQDPYNWRPPGGGESVAELCGRIDRFLDSLVRVATDKNVIVVCHGVIMWAFRVRLERMTSDVFKELYLSKDPQNKIHNCQILWYSKVNPKTQKCEDQLDWVQSVNPINPEISSGWKRIERPKYSNKALAAHIEAIKDASGQ